MNDYVLCRSIVLLFLLSGLSCGGAAERPPQQDPTEALAVSWGVEPIAAWSQDQVQIDWTTQSATRLVLSVNDSQIYSTADQSALTEGSIELALDTVELPAIVRMFVQSSAQEDFQEERSLRVGGADEIVEPNDDVVQDMHQVGVVGSLVKNGDQDVYRVNVEDESWLRVIVQDESGSCPSASILSVGVAGRPPLAMVVAEAGQCPSLDPSLHPSLVELVGGEYLISYSSLTSPTEESRYLLRYETGARECGNGIHESGEQCDDGNHIDDDSCANSCSLNLDVVMSEVNPRARLEFNDEGFVDVFLDIPSSGSSVTVSFVDGCPGVPDIALLSPDNFLLGFSANAGDCSIMSPVIDTFAAGLRAGRYVLSFYTNQSVPPGTTFEAHVDFVEPDCGNGILEWSFEESCEPSEFTPGLCTDECQVQGGVREIEPNEADAMTWQRAQILSAYLEPGGVDAFDVTISEDNSFELALSTSPDDSSTCRSKFDPFLVIRDTDGNVVNENDDRLDGNLCPRLTGDISSGSYRIEVRGFNEDVEGPYHLRWR